MARQRATSGRCIICGHETTDRSESGGRKHWQCADTIPCALRRNARRARPRPEAEIRAQFAHLAGESDQ